MELPEKFRRLGFEQIEGRLFVPCYEYPFFAPGKDGKSSYTSMVENEKGNLETIAEDGEVTEFSIEGPKLRAYLRFPEQQVLEGNIEYDTDLLKQVLRTKYHSTTRPEVQAGLEGNDLELFENNQLIYNEKFERPAGIDLDVVEKNYIRLKDNKGIGFLIGGLFGDSEPSEKAVIYPSSISQDNIHFSIISGRTQTGGNSFSDALEYIMEEVYGREFDLQTQEERLFGETMRFRGPNRKNRLEIASSTGQSSIVYDLNTGKLHPGKVWEPGARLHVVSPLKKEIIIYEKDSAWNVNIGKDPAGNATYTASKN